MKNLLLSVAIGDIGGSTYEFDPQTDYDLIDLEADGSDYTDDSVCTFACAESLLTGRDMGESLWSHCRQDPNRGYGGRFRAWLYTTDYRPYNSFGNGSTMRCAAAAFLAGSEDDCLAKAELTALPTHNHPEGIKGAQATALAIYKLLHGATIEDIRRDVLLKYYPAQNFSYDQIKPGFRFDETCQHTVPAALITFIDSTSFTDCLKKAVALGGDADTLAAIAAPMAYAYFREMPDSLVRQAKRLLPEWMLKINDEVDSQFAKIGSATT